MRPRLPTVDTRGDPDEAACDAVDKTRLSTAAAWRGDTRWLPEPIDAGSEAVLLLDPLVIEAMGEVVVVDEERRWVPSVRGALGDLNTVFAWSAAIAVPPESVRK